MERAPRQGEGRDVTVVSRRRFPWVDVEALAASVVGVVAFAIAALASAAARVEAIGGTISVVSPRGGGTALHVLLPLAPKAGARSSFEAVLGERVANARSDADAERRPVGRDHLAH